MIKRPMKGATWKKKVPIPYPVLATPKIDGIRFLIRDGKAITAQFKPIPNRGLRKFLELNIPEGMDGELKMPGLFHNTSSAVMSHDADVTGLKIMVFDYVKNWDVSIPYIDRMKHLSLVKNKFIQKLIPVEIRNDKELLAYEKWALKQKHEGIMLRIPEGGYKSGRSTLRAFWLVKFVRTLSAEAKVTGFKQLLSNQNEQEINELGRHKRSSKKAGKVAKPMVGSFIGKVLNGPHKGKTIKAGGLKRELQIDAYKRSKKYLGKVFTFEYKPYGEKDLPRQPRFKAWRKGY